MCHLQPVCQLEDQFGMSSRRRRRWALLPKINSVGRQSAIRRAVHSVVVEALERRTLLSGGTFVVSTLADSGPGSLRQAITDADAAGGTDIISFAGNVAGTIGLASQLPALITNITIDGPRAGLLSVNGNGFGSVFTINSGVTAEIENLTITGGNANNSGGGISNSGTLTVVNSNVSGNITYGSGGGIYSYGILTVTGSTISGNSASGAGGGIGGGAITVANSTISENSALNGGGISSQFGAGLMLTDSTVSGNQGAGIFASYALINGTIIAANTDRDISSNRHHLHGSNDLIGDGSDSQALTSSLRGTTSDPLNPMLSPLGNFGGPTPTMALLTGSPAIGAGANFPVLDSGGNDITVADQRGFARPQGSGIDIGAYQAGLVVNTLTDPATPTTGILSLREAIVDANEGIETIYFMSGLTGTIHVGSQLPAISANVTIDGPGADQLTINGGGFGSVLTVGSGITAEIENLTITGGVVALNDGGGIYNGGSLTVIDSTISGNSAGAGGGIFSRGTLSVVNSSISGNSAFGYGGGITSYGSLSVTDSTISGNTGFGGIVQRVGAVTVVGSTISQNSDTGIYSAGLLNVTGSSVSDNRGAGIFCSGVGREYGVSVTDSTINGNSNGGITSNGRTVTIADSTISQNVGGGIANNNAGTLTVVNSTISENLPNPKQSGELGSGIISYGPLSLTDSTVSDNIGVGIRSSNSVVTVTNSTISGNSASFDAGIDAISGTLVLTDSTISGNTGGGIFAAKATIDGSIIAANSGPDIENFQISLSGTNDLIGDGSDNSVLVDSLRGTSNNPLNPFLSPLANNGGSTQTMALLSGSPAINADANFPIFDANGNDITATDQRGVGRPEVGGIDIGAYQAGPLVNTLADPAAPSPGIVSLREAIAYTDSVGGNQMITFAAGLSGTINLASQLPSLTANVSIDGPATGQIKVAGQRNGAVFTVAKGVTTQIENLTITGGSNSYPSGGGILNSGTLTLTNSIISGNSGNGVYNNYNATITVKDSIISGNSAFGLSNLGLMTIENSTVSGNSGSGIYNDPSVNYSRKTDDLAVINVINSTIRDNKGNAQAGGVTVRAGTVTLTNCNISGNSGSGIFNQGTGTVTIVNTTISGNGNGGVFSSAVVIIDSTICGNSATAGVGGLGVTSGVVDGTIIAGNVGGDVLIRSGATVSGSNDLIGDGSDGGVFAVSLRGTTANPLNPGLAPLGNYGGLTQTMALLPGSPAIGAGANFPVLDANGNDIMATDQRGVARPQGLDFDIGAFQSGVNFSPVISSANGATIYTGLAATFTVEASAFPPAVLTETGNLPNGLTFHDNGNGTATISGTAAAGTSGVFNLTLTASNGIAPSAMQVFSLAVIPSQAPAITSANSATFLSNVGGTFTITSTGSPTSALTESRSVPFNVSFIDDGDGTGTLLIKPNSSNGIYTLTFTAQNGIGPVATQVFTLSIDQAPTITSSSPMIFADGYSGSYIITTSGFPTATITEKGNLPSGLTLENNGDGTANLSGTPAAGTDGTYTFTLTADNGVAPAATQIVTLAVVAPTTLIVTSTADSGAGSLRAAITSAEATNSPAIINFAPGLTGTIGLASQLPTLTGIVAINGSGAGLVTVNGGGFGSVFAVIQGIATEIDNLTITGGSGFLGGGISNGKGVLTVNNCDISGNSGSGYGSGIFNLGMLTVTDSTITGNSGYGGGISTFGPLTISDSTVSENDVTGIYCSGNATIINTIITGNSGPGIINTGHTVSIEDSTIGENFGGITNNGILTVTNSAISGNFLTKKYASIGEAGIYNTDELTLIGCTVNENAGIGIFTRGGTLTITDSTIAQNSNSDSKIGGGISAIEGAAVVITESTINGNSAPLGGGIGFQTAGGTLVVTDSTISGNSGGGVIALNATIDGTIIAANTGQDITSSKLNLAGSNDLIGDGSDGGILTNSLRGTVANPLNPMLAPLGDYGGATETMPLLAGSPAIGVGANFPVLDTSGNDITATDQRGFARPANGVDIGADQGALFAGDSNFDGIVNLTDLLTLLNNYGQTGKNWTQGDFNFDGTVNLTDLLILLNHYGQSASDTSVITPTANVITYKAKSSPFASEPMRLNSSECVGVQAFAPADVDSEILQPQAGVQQ